MYKGYKIRLYPTKEQEEKLWKHIQEGGFLSMSVFNKVISHSEKVTGLSVKEIRAYTPGQFRKHIENRHNTKLSFVSEFPVIGRGNVLRDDFVSRDVLDAEIDEILSGANK